MTLARTYWVHALTPLHVGSGRGVGFVDLPVMREKVSAWPIIPGSTMKGILRSHWESANGERSADERLMHLAFGRAADDEGQAGAVVFSDARLVLLPIRSLYGTFAWVTCPLALERLRRDFRWAGWTDLPAVPCDGRELAEEEVLVATGTSLTPPATGAGATGGKVYLEDLDLRVVAEASPVADEWVSFFGRILYGSDETVWPRLLRQRLAIVGSDVFTYLAEFGTEVVARIRMDPEKRTVDSHGLWYEENLPAETVLAGLALCERVYGRKSGVDGERPGSPVEPTDLLAAFCSGELRVQVGGKASVGRGLARLLFTDAQVGRSGRDAL